MCGDRFIRYTRYTIYSLLTVQLDGGMSRAIHLLLRPMRVIVVRGFKACFAGWDVQASNVPSERRRQDRGKVSELRSQIEYSSFEGGGSGVSDVATCGNRREGLAFFVTVLSGDAHCCGSGQYAACRERAVASLKNLLETFF